MPIDEPVKKGGFVYFMTNQAIPGHVKIGSTRLHPDERARQLSSGTAVARPFKVIEFEWFEDGVLLHAERELHAKYRQYRVPNREFFEIDVTPEMARAALLEVRNLLAASKPLDRDLVWLGEEVLTYLEKNCIFGEGIKIKDRKGKDMWFGILSRQKVRPASEGAGR